MKLLLAFSLLTAAISSGGESSLTTTYQPFFGLGYSRITIAPVICHDWYSHSGQATAIPLISAKNVPPTNNPKEAVEDVNIASRCKVYFYTNDIGDLRVPPEMTMDVASFVVPQGNAYPREEIIRACLECLRRCLPERLVDIPLSLKATDADKEWVSKITEEFNSHDRRKVFFSPEK
ncbi:hypothetical protein JIN84_01350 [Luteolibacter yonseiensis]|uniref:Uncharacterized protein n=1 Tax=Luteolibacter yonseiensis TaxID=1144680 RepID=A0A934V8L9_9BACT|nr:hypothetical protein [Luteolibacter yonseiensis]MBK1814253.1 hypothetical protein [Luteolibacter yonseiensis]